MFIFNDLHNPKIMRTSEPKIKGTSIYRTLYFLPSVTMAAAVAMVWKWIYNEKMGILNSAIRALGGKGIGWLTDPKIALYSVMIGS